MILKRDFEFITLTKGSTSFKFLETGDIFEIISNGIMINMFNGNEIDGSLNNIYIRLYKDKVFKVIPLLGIKSKSKISYNGDSILFEGEDCDLRYSVKFTLSNENIWFYEIDVYGNEIDFDILYCQDVGISNKKSCITNELYVSQYIDHKVLNSEENGYVICSRQNQEQNGKFPYVEHGSLNSRVISYSTDQMQFFSKDYKLTDIPFFLDKDLQGEIYQFELSYIAMQTEKIRLINHKNVVFYGLFEENHDGAIEESVCRDKIRDCFLNLDNNRVSFKPLNKVEIKKDFAKSLVSEKFLYSEINEIYDFKKFIEYKDEEMLSFFTKDHSHVVLQDKEILCERPHGNIILGGIKNFEKINKSVISSTNYMFGVFNSHLVVGNTVLNKMISVNRGLLNIFKSTGQRIYVKIDEEFRLLTLPGIYEVGLNFSIWYYKIKNDVLIIRVYSSFDYPNVFLEVESKSGTEYEFIITNQLVMGENEYENSCNVSVYKNEIRVEPIRNSFLKSVYPNMFYSMRLFECEFALSDDRIFFNDNMPRNKTLMTLKISNTNKFKLSIHGFLEGNQVKQDTFNFYENRNDFNNFYTDLMNGFSIEGQSVKYDFEKINEILYFYVHNALIHFISPHGLEQSNGGAWGTRDICQGPVEFFMSMGNYGIVKEIILEIFSHQFMENGEWPQWFMFDKYNMQQDGSHGDIVFWPLKVLGEYILKTGDKSILNEECVYRSFPNCGIVRGESVIEHVKRAVDGIKSRFLNGTYMISYDGGDWNDTLQPVSEELKKSLVSTWVMALAYETFLKLYKVVDDLEFKSILNDICLGIKSDFLTFAVKDNVISGFIYFKDTKNIEYLIHPSDSITKINYRLLPLTRSIISEIVDLRQSLINEELIEKHLMFNDGVRLMSNVPKYNGGVCKIFKRAEQASNVGREVSLQYVHAHIRFIEAMCKIGRSKKVWEALFKINPINIKDSVENADYRQSNCYFSSSDGDFKSRYDFEDRFNDLKNGNIGVKGGWRIYSSGPGIYISQVISNVVGIREEYDRVIFDPILPDECEDFVVNYKILGKKVRVKYAVKNDTITKIILNGREIFSVIEGNSYRNNFRSVSKEILNNELHDGENIFEIL